MSIYGLPWLTNRCMVCWRFLLWLWRRPECKPIPVVTFIDRVHWAAVELRKRTESEGPCLCS